MSISVGKYSRLRFFNAVTADGAEFFDLTPYATIPQQVGDLTYTVKHNDRIDRLANAFYGAPELWWVIAVANDLELLPSDLRVGDIIRIPSPNYILTKFFDTASAR